MATVTRPRPMYRYSLMSTGQTSRRFGRCEICGRYIEEVYIQIERRWPKGSWTLEGCRDLAGCRECLMRSQR